MHIGREDYERKERNKENTRIRPDENLYLPTALPSPTSLIFCLPSNKI